VIDRRVAGKFRETLSIFMVRVSALGALLVLVDLRLNLVVAGQTIQIGGTGFSDQLKGAVIALILVSGYSAVKEYWLGASEGGQAQSASMSRIAEASAPTAAAAVAAASSSTAPLKTDEVKIEAQTATVTEVQPKGST
jgi:hypothetical protein